jgi:hypothetical protein
MFTSLAKLRRTTLAFTVGASLMLSGWESVTKSGATYWTANASTASQRTSAASVPGLLEVNDQTWTPEAFEDLLAPVALYPDEFIGHVLVAATNPQEVLDAGNWRPKNENLDAKALDASAKRAGFTPPIRMLLQNPIVLDMMCSEFGWMQELGQAYVNDQAGVLDAIQRLRRQARDAGNLESSDKMLVETEIEGGQQAITLSSPAPGVVNVPQYDVEKVYTALDDQDDGGVSTGTAVITSLLAFGGGLALGTLFDDDDDDDWDDDDYYHPVYYGQPMPYYAHYAYRPVYPGYYPSAVYAPPPAYRHAYTNTTVVHRTVNNYWTRYDDRAYVRRDRRATVSPITRARPNRPELQTLNERSRRGSVRRAPAVEEERGRYQVTKRETAARAERRRAAEGQRQAPRVERAGPLVDDRAGTGTGDRAGTRRGSRVDTRVTPRPGKRAGDPAVTRRNGRANAGDVDGARARDRAGKAVDDTRDRTGGGGYRVRPDAGGESGERVRPKAGGGSGERVRPKATGGTANPATPKAADRGGGTGRGNKERAGQRRGTGQGRSDERTKAAPVEGGPTDPRSTTPSKPAKNRRPTTAPADRPLALTTGMGIAATMRARIGRGHQFGISQL